MDRHADQRGGDLHLVKVAFTAALEAEDLHATADAHATAALVQALSCGDRDQVAELSGGGQLPLLLAISDNGPQMRSVSTRQFPAGVATAQQFGRPHTPTDQAWIETLFGHVKGEWPHLERIRDGGELDRIRGEYNRLRLHAAIGYVTPTTNTKAKMMPCAKHAATDSPRTQEPHQLPSKHNPRGKPMTAPRPGRVFPPAIDSRTQTHLRTASAARTGPTPHPSDQDRNLDAGGLGRFPKVPTD